MQKLFYLTITALILTTTFSGCKKEDKTVTREDLLGTYDFTNNYTIYTRDYNANPQTMDTTSGSDTYNFTIYKPNPDNMGEKMVVISGFLKYNSNEAVYAEISADGNVLVGDNFFEGIINGNTIQFDYSLQIGFSSDDKEVGKGTATKRH